ncbi:MAG: discoidin domain-containing protein [Lentisphaerae bacterium]|nr:discoidin domain-containing protein [Lentisphaerota bacterium]
MRVTIGQHSRGLLAALSVSVCYCTGLCDAAVPPGWEWRNVANVANGGRPVCSDDAAVNKAFRALEGDRRTPWLKAVKKGEEAHLEIAFVRDYTVSRIVLYPVHQTAAAEYGRDYRLQYFDGTTWQAIVAKRVERLADRSRVTVSFEPINTRKVRVTGLQAGLHGLRQFEAHAQVPGAVRLSDGTLLTEETMAALPHSLSGKPLLLNDGWRLKIGDNFEYANVNFPDTDWAEPATPNKLRVGRDGDWVWYRVGFELPTGWEDRDILLDVGQLSSFEEVYLNGKKAVTFGDPEALFTIPAKKYPSSKQRNPKSKYYVHQRLPLPAGALKAGRNLLAIRVKVTSKCLFGSYGGWPALREYRPVFGRLLLKSDGADAIRTLLTPAEHLSRYEPGERIVVKPELFSLHGSTHAGEIILDVYDKDGRNVLTRKTPARCTGSAGHAEALLRFEAPSTEGRYRAELAFTADGQELWRGTAPFTVRNRLTFTVPVVPEIQDSGDLPVRVSDAVIGAYGPGLCDFGKKTFKEYRTEVRGGLVCATVLGKNSPPLLVSTQVRATPLRPVLRPDMITWPAGWEDAWFYGYVTPGDGNRDSFELESARATWSGRTYRYTYPDGVTMDFSVSNANPAYRVQTNARKLRVFDRMADFGIGPPTFIACRAADGVRTTPAKVGLTGSDMAANWVLAWFSNANGWEEFDVPFLFVLENRPTRVKTGDGALQFEFPGDAGTVQGMPLYGITLQAPEATAGWHDALPAEVVQRCRFWSQALTAAPVEVVRTAKVDYGADHVTIRDQFEHLDLRDDWGTEAVKLSFLPPALVLAESAGNIGIATGQATRDLQYGTLHGPLLAVENSAELRIRLSGLLHLVREVRVVEQATTAEAAEVRKDLNVVIEELWRKGHPFLDDTKLLYSIGPSESLLTNTLRALPLLKQPLRDQVAAGLKTQTRKHLFYAEGTPMLSITNPHTGLRVGFRPHYRCGTDTACWEALHIYVAWRYAHEFDDYAFVKEHYETVKLLYNASRNTHDWQICGTWDTFGGKRVGNGLQETNIIHGGAVCMARLAQKFGDPQTFGWASYHAAIQVIGMQAQIASSEFRRAYRPWSSGHSHRRRYEDQETWLPRYHAEQNAYAGFSYEDMSDRHSVLGGSRSYCMTHVPELMRPYELWLDYGDEFFGHPNVYEFVGAQPINWTPFDPVFYLASKPPIPWDDFKERRLRLARSERRWTSLKDFCGILDYLGQISYKRLW